MKVAQTCKTHIYHLKTTNPAKIRWWYGREKQITSMKENYYRSLLQESRKEYTENLWQYYRWGTTGSERNMILPLPNYKPLKGIWCNFWKFWMLPVLCSLFVLLNGYLENNIEKHNASDDLGYLRSGSNTALQRVVALPVRITRHGKA